MLLLSFPFCRSIGQLTKAKIIIFFLMACGLASQSLVAESNEAITIKLGKELHTSLWDSRKGLLELNKGCSIQYSNGIVTDIINCPNDDYNYVKSGVSPDVIPKALTSIGLLVNETSTKLSKEQGNTKKTCIQDGFKLVWEKRYLWGWFAYYYPIWRPDEKCFDEEKNPQLVSNLKHALNIVQAVSANLIKINDDGIRREFITKLHENYIELKKHYPISNTDLEIKTDVHLVLEKLINLNVYQITVKITPPVLTNIRVEAETPAYTAYEIRVGELLSRAGVQYDESDSKTGIYIDNFHGKGSWKYCDDEDNCRMIKYYKKKCEDKDNCQLFGNNEYLSAENGAKLHYQPDLQNGDGELASLSFYAWDQAYKTERVVSLDWATLSLEVKQVIEPVNNEPTFGYDKLPWEVDENLKKEFKRPVARDVDEDKLTYRLEDPENKFKLKGDKIVLEQKLDYEKKSLYELILIADDKQGGIAELEITVRVEDVNEAPEITSDLPEYVIQDNKEGDGFQQESIIFTLQATDQDSGDQDDLKYLIEDNNGDHKNVYESQYGILTVDDKGTYKYSPSQEKINTINDLKVDGVIADSFKLAVTDAGGLTDTIDFKVKLQNINNKPTLGNLTCFDTQDNGRQVKVLFDDGYYKCQIEINDPDTKTTAWQLKVGDQDTPQVYRKGSTFLFSPSKKDIDNQYIQITVIDGGESKSKIYGSQSLSLKPTTAKTSGFLKGRFSEGEIKAHTDDSTLKWKFNRNENPNIIKYTVKHAASKNCQNATVKWDQKLDDKWHPVDIQLVDINGDTLDDLLVFSSDKTTTKVSIHYNRVLKKHECSRVWEESPKKINLVEKLANFTHPTSIKSIAGLHGHSKPVRYFLLHSHITGKAKVVALKFDSESKQLTLIEPTSDTTSEPPPNQDKKAVAVLTADISWLGDWNGVKVKESEQKSRFNASAVIVGQLVTERKQDGTVNFSELTPENVWVDYVTYSLDDNQPKLIEDAERGKVDDPQANKHLILPEETNMYDIQAHHLSSVWVHGPQPAAPELYSSLDQTKFLLQSTDLDMNEEPEYFIVRDNVVRKKDMKDKLSAMTLQSEKAGEQSKHRRQLQQISTDAPLNIIHTHSPQLASEAGFIMQTPGGVAKHIAANCKENKDQLFSQCLKHWKTKVEWHEEVNEHGEKSKKGRRVLAQLSSYKKLIDVFDQFYTKKSLNPLEQFGKLRPEEFEKLADSHSLKIEKIMSAAFQGAEEAELLEMIAVLPEALPMVILIMLLEQHFLESQDIKETRVYNLDTAKSEKEYSPADKLFNTKILDKNTFKVIDLINKSLHSEKLDLKNPSSQSIPNILELENSGTNSIIQACPDDKDKLCVDDLFEISNLESKNPKINLINQDRDNFNKPKVSFLDDNQSIIEISVTIDEKKVRLVYVPIGVDSNNKVKFGLALMEHDVFRKNIIRKTWDYVDGEVILFKRGEFKSWQDAQQTKFDPHYVKTYYYGDYQWRDNQNKDQIRKYLDYTVAMNIASGSQSAKEISLPIREHYYYTKDKAGEGLKLKSTYIANLNDQVKKEGTSLAKFNCLQGGACLPNMDNTNNGVSEYYTVPGYVYRPIEDKWAAVHGLKITRQGLELLIDSGKKDIPTLSQIDPPGYTSLETSLITDIGTTDELIDDEENKYYFPSYRKQLEAIALMTLSLNKKFDPENAADNYIKKFYKEYSDYYDFSKLDNKHKEELNRFLKSTVKNSLNRAYKQVSNLIGYSYNSDSSGNDFNQSISSMSDLSVSDLRKKLIKTEGSCSSGELVWVLENGSPNDMLFASMASTLLDNDFVQDIKTRLGNKKFDPEASEQKGSKYGRNLSIIESKGYQFKFPAISYRFPDNEANMEFFGYRGKWQNNIGGFGQINIKYQYPEQWSFFSLLQVYQLQCLTGVTTEEPLTEKDILLRLKRSVSIDRHGYITGGNDSKLARNVITTTMDFDVRIMPDFQKWIDNAQNNMIDNAENDVWLQQRINIARLINPRVKNIKILQVGIKLIELPFLLEFPREKSKYYNGLTSGYLIERLIANPQRLREYDVNDIDARRARVPSSVIKPLAYFGFDLLNTGLVFFGNPGAVQNDELKISTRLNIAKNFSLQVLSSKIALLGDVECPVRRIRLYLTGNQGNCTLTEWLWDGNWGVKLWLNRKIKNKDKITFGNIINSFPFEISYGYSSSIGNEDYDLELD